MSGSQARDRGRRGALRRVSGRRSPFTFALASSTWVKTGMWPPLLSGESRVRECISLLVLGSEGWDLDGQGTSVALMSESSSKPSKGLLVLTMRLSLLCARAGNLQRKGDKAQSSG